MSSLLDPFTPTEIVQAVTLLLNETEHALTTVRSKRQGDLGRLYLMLRTLIRGQGFAPMDDLGEGDEDEEEGQDGLGRRIGEEEREAFERFMNDYRVVDE
jgi:hypothetical protein